MFRSLIALVAAGVFVVLPSVAPAKDAVDLSSQKFENSAAVAGGQGFSFEMGAKRVNWTQARWSVLELPAVADWSGSAGLRVRVLAEKLRDDAHVSIALQQGNGVWFYHAKAVDLVAAANTGDALFEDFYPAEWVAPRGGNFRDEDFIFDPRAVKAIAVGVVNPFGVGNVSFTLAGIELLPADKAVAAPVKVAVTGKLLDVNGTSAIPAGLFGGYHLAPERFVRYRLAQDRRVHNTGGVTAGGPNFGNALTHMMLNVVGERVMPADRLKVADWKAKAQATAKQYADAAKAAGKPLYVEFYNEPYLNWANKNRINFNPGYYKIDEAKEGGPVTLKDGTVMPHLKWTKNYDAPPWNWTDARGWRRGRDEAGKVVSPYHAEPYFKNREPWFPESFPPATVKDGEKYTATWTETVREGGKQVKKPVTRELTAFTPWHIYDETQFTYWSAQGMHLPMFDMMEALGEKLHELHPSVVFIAGWGYRPSEDNWAAWEMNYRPMIDRGHKYIDGIHDHDYGGDPTKMAASYEVVTQYGVTKYGKWLHSYNTETASGADPQAVPEAAEGQGKSAAADTLKYQWAARKLMHALAVVPDKARSFSWFGYGGGAAETDGNGPWFSDKGEGVALEALINLRGRLVQVDNADTRVYVVAAIDGTDPQNPRPESMPKRNELVVAVLNDHQTPRVVQLNIARPGKSTFAAGASRLVVEAAGAPKIVRTAIEVAADAGSVPVEVTLPARGLAVFTFPLGGEAIEGNAAVKRRQFFSDAPLTVVRAAKPLTTTIAVPKEAVASARKVSIRFVGEKIQTGEGVLVLNGKTIAMPRVINPENTPYVREFAIDVADLKAENALEFRVQPGHAGYRLGAISIIVEE